MSDTQDEGEDFDVEWVPMTQAASRCSFGDDGRIVERLWRLSLDWTENATVRVISSVAIITSNCANEARKYHNQLEKMISFLITILSPESKILVTDGLSAQIKIKQEDARETASTEGETAGTGGEHDLTTRLPGMFLKVIDETGFRPCERPYIYIHI